MPRLILLVFITLLALPLPGNAASTTLEPAFDLVHAALVLEYVDAARALERMSGWLRPAGVLTVVLQEPSALAPPVSRTPYRSLLALEPLLRLVDSGELVAHAAKVGLHPMPSRLVPLPQGKSFLVVSFKVFP